MSTYNEFLDAYKKLESAIQLVSGTAVSGKQFRLPKATNDLSVYDFENFLTKTDDQEKLKFCRITRNYIQHNADYKRFVSISQEMVLFLLSLTEDIMSTQIQVKNKMVKIKPLLSTDTFLEAYTLLSKKNISWAPVIDAKSKELTGVITTQALLNESVTKGKIANKIKLKDIDLKKKIKGIKTIDSDTLFSDVQKGESYLVTKKESIVGIIEPTII